MTAPASPVLDSDREPAAAEAAAAVLGGRMGRADAIRVLRIVARANVTQHETDLMHSIVPALEVGAAVVVRRYKDKCFGTRGWAEEIGITPLGRDALAILQGAPS